MAQGHEKYGVDVSDEEGEKTARSKPTHCPTCGNTLETKANVLKCTRCGTLPFENPNASK